MIDANLLPITNAVINDNVRKGNVQKGMIGRVQISSALPSKIRKETVEKCINAIANTVIPTDAEKIAAFDAIYEIHRDTLLHILQEYKNNSKLPYHNFDQFASRHSSLPNNTLSAIFGKDIHQTLHELQEILTDPPDGQGYGW